MNIELTYRMRRFLVFTFCLVLGGLIFQEKHFSLSAFATPAAPTAEALHSEELPHLQQRSKSEITPSRNSGFSEKTLLHNSFSSSLTHPRQFSNRQHFRFPGHQSLQKNTVKKLSFHLTTLIHHISLIHPTLKRPCWQYASDFYVFAYWHILL